MVEVGFETFRPLAPESDFLLLSHQFVYEMRWSETLKKFSHYEAPRGGGLVVDRQALERGVQGSILTLVAVLCP